MFRDVIKKMNDNQIFYENIANDFTAIDELNDYLKLLNIYIEYYPRYFNKNNNNWILGPICLKIINLLQNEKIY